MDKMCNNNDVMQYDGNTTKLTEEDKTAMRIAYYGNIQRANNSRLYYEHKKENQALKRALRDYATGKQKGQGRGNKPEDSSGGDKS